MNTQLTPPKPLGANWKRLILATCSRLEEEEKFSINPFSLLRAANKCGLRSVGDLQAWLWILDQGTTPTGYATAAGISLPRASDRLCRLEAKGFLEAERGTAEDRRRTRYKARPAAIRKFCNAARDGRL